MLPLLSIVAATVLIPGTVIFVIAVIVLCQFFYATFRLRHVGGEAWYKAFQFAHLRWPHRANRVVLGKVRRYACDTDVFREHVALTPMLVTIAPADIVHVLASDDFERSPRMQHTLRETVPGSLFTLSPQTHRRARAQFRAQFSHDLLPRFHNEMRLALAELCTSLAAVADRSTPVDPKLSEAFPGSGNVVDVTNLLSGTSFRIIMDVACGVQLDAATRKVFATEADKMMLQMLIEYLFYPFTDIFKPLLGYLTPLSKSRDTLLSLCRELLTQRVMERRLEQVSSDPKRSTGGGKDTDRAEIRDLLDAIISVHGYDADDSCEDAVSQTLLFMIAGSHTTNSTTAWAIYELAQEKNKRVLKTLQEEIDSTCAAHNLGTDEMLPYHALEKLTFTRKTWKETLRLHPTTSGLPRMAVRDVRLRGSGTFVPKGAIVIGGTWGIQTDARYYTDPMRFDPERWGDAGNVTQADCAPAGAYLPFSAGPKNCAGQFFADYEGVCLLAEVFRRFTFSLACPSSHVKSYSGWIEVAKYDPNDSGAATIGVPVCVARREACAIGSDQA